MQIFAKPLLFYKQIKAGLGDPNISCLNGPTSYFLHRAFSTTPEFYENFLRTAVCAYIALVIETISGVTGFLTTFLLVYVLVGLFILIKDIDKPLGFSTRPLVKVRRFLIIQFNEKNKSMKIRNRRNKL